MSRSIFLLLLLIVAVSSQWYELGKYSRFMEEQRQLELIRKGLVGGITKTVGDVAASLPVVGPIAAATGVVGTVENIGDTVDGLLDSVLGGVSSRPSNGGLLGGLLG